MDLDSPLVGRFDEVDARHLQSVASLLIAGSDC